MSITVELSERELHLIAVSLWERERSILRKRSWRPSERAASVASVRALGRKLEAAKGGPLLLSHSQEEDVTEAATDAQKNI